MKQLKIFNNMIFAFLLQISISSVHADLLFSDDFNNNDISVTNWSISGNMVLEEDGVLKILTNQTDNGGQVSGAPFNLPSGVLTLTRKAKLHYANNFAMPWISLSYRDESNAIHNVFSIYYGNMSYNDSGHIPVYGTFLAQGDANPHWSGARNQTVEGPPVIWNEWFEERITYDQNTGEVRYYRNGTEEIVGMAPIIPTDTLVWITINAWGWYTNHWHYVDDLQIRNDVSTPAVVFFPGMAGSRLYTEGISGDNKLWIPNRDNDICKLKPDESGYGSTIYTKSQSDGGLLEEAVIGLNVYKGFIKKLNDLKDAKAIKEWIAFPYDWRRDVREIAAYTLDNHETGIIHGNNGNVENHIDLVEQIIALKQRSGPVTIIGHSNGGLLAKAVINQLAATVGLDHVNNYIDQVILVAVPQLGTPQGLLATLHGDFVSSLLWVGENSKREASETMPGALGLLPSEMYFKKADGNIIEFSTNPKHHHDLFNQLVSAFGNNINPSNSGTSSYYEFLRGTGTLDRNEPHTGNCIDTPSFSHLEPNAFRSNAFDKSVGMHAILDHWEPPAGVKVTQIAGYGLPTSRGIKYDTSLLATCDGLTMFSCRKETIIQHKSIDATSDGGDGTVLPVSAAALDLPTYWVNLKKGTSKKHDDLMEDDAVQSTIEAILRNDNSINHPRVTLDLPIDGAKSVRLTMKSPVDLQVYDEEGNHTGIIRAVDKLPNAIANIPGSTIRRISSHQVITLQGDRPYNVVLNGVDKGIFTLEIEVFDANGELVKVESFSALPATQQTNGVMSISAEMELSPLKLDYNGDGVIDSTISSEISDTHVFTSSLMALTDYILTLKLNKGTQQALLANIEAALHANDQKAAQQQLIALSNKIHAMSGKKFSANIEEALQTMLKGIYLTL